MKNIRITKEDRLFSEFIRKRAIIRVGGCERCLAQKCDVQKDNGDILPAWKLLDCAHLISRIHHGTAWDPDNALGLCSGCHLFFDREHGYHELFSIEKVGLQIYQQLLIRRDGIHHIDHAAVRLYLRKLIAELNYEAPY